MKHCCIYLLLAFFLLSCHEEVPASAADTPAAELDGTPLSAEQQSELSNQFGLTGQPVLCVSMKEKLGEINKEKAFDVIVNLYTADFSRILVQDKKATIKGRGNSTWYFPKKPYLLKFDKKIALFGMEEAKKWVLLANYLDPTRMDNAVAFELARRIGVPFTPQAQYVELWINNRYVGNYLLSEKVEEGQGRVEIDTKQGGVLMEWDTNFDEDYKDHTKLFKIPVMMQEPQSKEALDASVAHVNTIERIVNQSSFAYEDYDYLIDPQSLARFIILNDVVHNGEVGHPKSVFCFRRTGSSPVEFGPAWDYDWGFGYVGGKFIYFKYMRNFMFGPGVSAGQYNCMDFFNRFFADPAFRKVYVQTWREVYPQLSTIQDYVQQLGAELAVSVQRDHRQWKYDCADWSLLVNQMAGWLECRILWMNEYVETLNY